MLAGWAIELDDGGKRSRRVRASVPAASGVSAWVIPTNEELMIARHTLAAARARRCPGVGLTSQPRVPTSNDRH